MSAAPRRGVSDVLSLSLPIAGVQLAGVALTTTDVLMLQTAGVVAIAGGGLAMQFYNQIRTMCVGMVTAAGNAVAEAAAEIERDGAEAGDRLSRIVRASFAVATAAALVGALLVIALGALVQLLPIDDDVARLAFVMTLTLAPGLVPMLWLNVLRQFAVGMRRPGSLLVVTLISIAVNVGLNWLFISLATSDAWAVAGIGVSTTLVQVFTFGAFARTLHGDAELGEHLSFRPRAGDGEEIRRLVRLGIPVSLTYGSEAAITTIAGLVMGTMSAEMLAAHNVVNQIAYVVYQVCIGFSHGGSILVSRFRGDGRGAAAAVARNVLVCALAYLAVVGIAWLAAGKLVLWPFLSGADEQSRHIASVLLCIAVGQQFAKGTQNVLVGLLRGLGDTKSGLRATLIGYWGIGVPALAVLGLATPLEGYGVWIGLVLGFGTTAVILALYFRRGIAALPAAGRVAEPGTDSRST